MTTERRNLASKIELRTAGGKTMIRGFAARYGTLSSNLGGFRETIAHGAFRSALNRGDDVRCLFNHSANNILGRTRSGTLRLKEMCSGGAHSACGLWFECDLPNTTLARDLKTSIERGDLDGCSFAFAVPDGGDSWDEGTDENGMTFPRRTLRDINPLLDVSAVCYPAYPTGTSVDVDTLAPTEMLSLQVSPRALVEARARGGYGPKPKGQVVPRELMTELERHELRAERNFRELYHVPSTVVLTDFNKDRIRRRNFWRWDFYIAKDDAAAAYRDAVASFNRPHTTDPLTKAIRKQERKSNGNR